jgi:hypothetical protein
MWYSTIWLKKISIFLLAAIVYVALLPATVQSALGTFAVGWMLVDIVDKFFD